VQLPIGNARRAGTMVTVHGAAFPLGPTVVVLTTSQPIGTALLLPTMTGTEIDDRKATPGIRNSGASERAGYVAVIVAVVPSVPGHAHADHALAPS
jgi:hypothetical protein